jgi:hypothetical protein
MKNKKPKLDFLHAALHDAVDEIKDIKLIEELKKSICKKIDQIFIQKNNVKEEMLLEQWENELND